MARAIWKGVVIAESGDTKIVDGNHYFPPESVDRAFLRESDATTVCGWKGTAGYYDIVVDGEVNEQAAWFYASPMEAAKEIAGHVAFWKGVVVEAARGGEDLGAGESCDP